jgi:hypothetical protein
MQERIEGLVLTIERAYEAISEADDGIAEMCANYAAQVKVAIDALRPLPAADDTDDDELEPF